MLARVEYIAAAAYSTCIQPDLQSECLLAGRIAPNILQVLHSQSSGAVWFTLLPVQNEKLALLHARILLFCQHTIIAGGLGFPKLANLPQGRACSVANAAVSILHATPICMPAYSHILPCVYTLHDGTK